VPRGLTVPGNLIKVSTTFYVCYKLRKIFNKKSKGQEFFSSASNSRPSIFISGNLTVVVPSPK
jgi:hypothetical protein